MKVILRVAISKAKGTRYVALMGVKNEKTYTLTFDKYTIMSVCDMSPNALNSLEVGDYEV